MEKQDIFQKLKDELKANPDFQSFLSQKVTFDGRDWTAGQFLYKYCFDEFQPFAYYARDHFDTLSEREQALATQLKELHEKRLANPKNAYRFITQGESLDLFNGNVQKEKYYQKLFAGDKRSVADNPCYWHPVSRFQTAFVEYKLTEMGMSESQILSLMTHCEKEREKAEKKAIQTMPKQFVHNSSLPPDEMNGGRLDVFVRSDDNFLNLQKLAFVGTPNTFYAGLPLQSAVAFMAWSRFKPDILAFQLTPEEAKRQIGKAYNYKIDMSQKDAIRPCIPLWGGEPKEWVSAVPLSYEDVQPETLRDLMGTEKEFYLVPDKADWKTFMEGKEGLSTEQARRYMADLAKRFPDKVIKLDGQFLAEYEKEFDGYEADRKQARQERYNKIALDVTEGESMKKKLQKASTPVEATLPRAQKETVLGRKAYERKITKGIG